MLDLQSQSAMRKQPGIYLDIGKKARDLLYRDYTKQTPIDYHYRYLDWNCFLLFQVGDIVPGLSTVFRLFLPFQRFSTVELQYFHDYAGITAGISLPPKPPQLNFSGVIGNNLFCIGADVSFDTATATLAKCNAGLSFNTPILDASLTLNDKADTLVASCYRSLNPPTNTAIAADLTHSIFSTQTTLSFGMQHSIFPSLLVKARVNSNGGVGTSLQHEFFPGFYVTVAGETNVKDFIRSAKIGLSVALKH